MKKLALLLTLGSAVLLAGCSGPTTRYAWNDYSNHLYDYSGQEITQEQYLEYLIGAVDEAKKRNVRVAPGLYAEIGTRYAREGKYDDAISYYELERQTWPESEGFMSALIDGIKKNKAVTDGKSGSDATITKEAQP